MPDVTVEIGGRSFVVACQEGEEEFLYAAASLLDREAQPLMKSGVRLTQERMLLMAGLLLADKTLSAEDQLKATEEKLARKAAQVDELESRPEPTAVSVEVPVETPVMPEEVLERLTSLADQAQGIADRLKASG